MNTFLDELNRIPACHMMLDAVAMMHKLIGVWGGCSAQYGELV